MRAAVRKAHEMQSLPRTVGTSSALLLLVMLHLWPLSLDPARLALHRNADTMVSEWLVSWPAHVLVTGNAHLFDTNIFWPEPRTLTFGDPVLVPALMRGADPVARWFAGPGLQPGHDRSACSPPRSPAGSSPATGSADRRRCWPARSARSTCTCSRACPTCPPRTSGACRSRCSRPTRSPTRRRHDGSWASRWSSPRQRPRRCTRSRSCASSSVSWGSRGITRRRGVDPGITRRRGDTGMIGCHAETRRERRRSRTARGGRGEQRRRSRQHAETRRDGDDLGSTRRRGGTETGPRTTRRGGPAGWRGDWRTGGWRAVGLGAGPACARALRAVRAGGPRAAARGRRAVLGHASGVSLDAGVAASRLVERVLHDGGERALPWRPRAGAGGRRTRPPRARLESRSSARPHARHAHRGRHRAVPRDAHRPVRGPAPMDRARSRHPRACAFRLSRLAGDRRRRCRGPRGGPRDAAWRARTGRGSTRPSSRPRS